MSAPDIRFGWGRYFGVPSKVKNMDQNGTLLLSVTSSNGLPIGLGRSYGDSGLNSTGISWSSSQLKEIHINPETKVAYCESGVTTVSYTHLTLPTKRIV